MRINVSSDSSQPKPVSFWRNPRRGSARVLFWIHWAFGLIFGLYFAVVCLTGAIVVYKKELERASIPHLTTVPAGSQRASFAAITDKVREAFPAHQLNNAYLYQEPGVTWSFRLQGEDGRTQVYVNSYTAQIVGSDNYQSSILQWVYDLHADLLMGKTGFVVNAIGGFCLFGMCVTGLVLWWPRNRLSQGFRLQPSAGWKRQVYDLHKVGGILTLFPLALLAVTGAYWGFPQQYEAALGFLSGGPGRVNAPTVAVLHTAEAPSLDAMLESAIAAMPDAEPTLFTFSRRPDAPHTLRMRLPGDWRTIGDHSVYIHPNSGEVVQTVLHNQLPLGARLQRDIYSLHFGTFGGHATRVLWIFCGLAGAGLFLTGVLMYGNRVLVKRWRTATLVSNPGRPAKPLSALPNGAQSGFLQAERLATIPSQQGEKNAYR